MPRMSIMGAYRNIPDTITYVPKAGCGPRTFTVNRAADTLGNTGIKPLILRDADFGDAATFNGLVAPIAQSGLRQWDAPINAWRKTAAGAAGITKSVWDTLRFGVWANTEMVGCMIAAVKQGTATDFFISAAPNMIYKSSNGSYNPQPPGDNKGTQVHSEMIMAAQLRAFVDAIGRLQETPLGFQKYAIPIATSRNGPAFAELEIEADLYIEKGSMCKGCSGTWDTTIGEGTYRI